jgi:hypothetical protein
MRRARLIMVALLVSGRAVCAQPVDPGGRGLGVCLQAARAADEECARLGGNPAARIECFHKARGAELECLDRVMSVAPAAAPGRETPAAAALPAPSATASPEVAPIAEPPKAEVAVSPPEPPKAEVAASPPEPPKAEVAVSPPEPPKAEAAVSPPEPPTASISASAPPARDLQGKDQQAKDQDTTPPANPEPVQATEPSPPAASAAASAEVTQPHEPDTATLRESSWVVSETTSPVDFSPLITAVIRPASRLHDGPSSLTVRCRRGRTELSIWSDAGWHSARNDAVLVDHRVNKEPIVRQMWSLSADARTATYREDAVELLRSLPEGGLLSISLPDGDNARREATFLLTGWTAIRQKIEKLCKWPPPERVTYGQAREPSDRREGARAEDSSSLSPAIPSSGPRRRAPAPPRTRH